MPRSFVRLRLPLLFPLIVTFVTFAAAPCAAQVTVDAFRGDRRNDGPRSSALAGALGSDSYDIESALINPAGLNTLRRPGIALTHRLEWDQQIYDESVAGRIGKWSDHAVGASVRLTHAGQIGAERDLRFQLLALDLIYAYELVTDLSVGLTGGVRLGSLDAKSMTGYSVSLGLLYTPSPALSYGLTVNGLGPTLIFPPSQLITEETTLRKDVARVEALEVSTTMRYPTNSRTNAMQLLLSVEHNLRLNYYRYRGGLELLPFDFLFIRGGYLAGDRGMPTWGAGIRFGGFDADFAIMPNEGGDRFHQFGLKYAF